MNSLRLPALAYFLLLVMGLLQWAQAYPQLPETMASHFAADGTPNGWQSKQTFFLLTAMIIAVTTIPTFFAARKISRRSPDKINLPHKDYWLSQEHQGETWRFISAFMGWFGCALLFVLLYSISQAINFNLPSIHRFDTQGMWYVLGGFLFFVISGLVYFVHHFYNVPPSVRAPRRPGSLWQ
jgi:uncharacterized membrane protein